MLKRIIGNLSDLVPGVLLALAVAIPSTWLHGCYTPVSAVAIAMLLGLLLRNTLPIPSVCNPGTGFVVNIESDVHTG